jgi:hypothetical protein
MNSIITYSLEACNPTKAEMKNINRIMENIITRILMVNNNTKGATIHRDWPAGYGNNYKQEQNQLLK